VQAAIVLRMIPMRTSSIFKSRWLALVWAAGIIWLAYDFAGSLIGSSGDGANSEQATEPPVTPEDEKTFEEVLNGL
jgi:hypothetical protein